jgi:hypothetical protein
MRFVDGKPRDPRLGDRLQKPLAGEPLGGDVDKARVAGADPPKRRGDLFAAHRRRDHLNAVDAPCSQR